MADVDCLEPTSPLCVDGQCVSCQQAPGDRPCEAANAGTPVCTSTGECVECSEDDAELCGGDTPACGPDNRCTSCSENESCLGSACDFETGRCFETVIYVDQVTCPSTGNGTTDAPFCALSDAWAQISPGVDTAVLADGGAPYSGPFQVPPSTKVALRGFSNAAITSVQDAPLVAVPAGSTLYLDRFALFGGQRVAIDCDACTLEVRRCTLQSNAGGGIVATAGSDVRISISSIVDNGQSPMDGVGGIAISGGAIEIDYSTLAGNNAVVGAAGLTCAGSVSGAVRNSILAGLNPPSVDCPTATFEGNAAGSSALGPSNVDIGPLSPAWFVDLGNGDVHLSPTGEVEIPRSAQWRRGDPLRDFDHEPIPQVSESFPGFDQP